MTKLVVYDATDTDQQQIKSYIEGQALDCEFVPEKLSADNVRPDAEIISVFITSTVEAGIIEKFPKLQLIACRSTGFNNVDLAAAKKRNISVENVPTYGENTVSEFTFALIFALTRKLPEAIQAIDAAEFDQSVLTGMDLADKTLGIVGAGRIGRHVARAGVAFGMKVLAYDVFPDEQKAKEIGYSYASLDEIAQRGDVISIHAPFIEENRHVIGPDFLSKVKPTAYLVNTARGELVDTNALIQALKDGRLAGAGLDVLEGEHLVKFEQEVLLLRGDTIPQDQLLSGVQIDILRRMPNVILTPHNAFNTTEAIGRINKTTIDNVVNFLKGQASNQVKAPAVKPGKLILARHGESEWNASGKWTGSRDVHLSEKGFHQAALLGLALRGQKIDYAFVSQQIRAFETFQGMIDAAQQFDVPYERSGAINERDYGDYTGMNKWQVKEQLGEDVFHHLRRDWNYPVPKGETLQDVYERAVPFYLEHILPKLKEGKDVLVVSHGNSMRALIKYLENISDTAIADVEMPFGNILIYQVDEKGRMTRKEERKIDTQPVHA